MPNHAFGLAETQRFVGEKQAVGMSVFEAEAVFMLRGLREQTYRRIDAVRGHGALEQLIVGATVELDEVP